MASEQDRPALPPSLMETIRRIENELVHVIIEKGDGRTVRAKGRFQITGEAVYLRSLTGPVYPIGHGCSIAEWL